MNIYCDLNNRSQYTTLTIASRCVCCAHNASWPPYRTTKIKRVAAEEREREQTNENNKVALCYKFKSTQIARRRRRPPSFSFTLRSSFYMLRNHMIAKEFHSQPRRTTNGCLPTQTKVMAGYAPGPCHFVCITLPILIVNFSSDQHRIQFDSLFSHSVAVSSIQKWILFSSFCGFVFQSWIASA